MMEEEVNQSSPSPVHSIDVHRAWPSAEGREREFMNVCEQSFAKEANWHGEVYVELAESASLKAASLLLQLHAVWVSSDFVAALLKSHLPLKECRPSPHT